MPAPRPLLRRTAALAVLGGAVGMSVRALARPRPGGERRLIDWEAVRRTARARSGERVGLRREKSERLGALYDRIAAEMVPLMAEVCGTAPVAIPRFTVLDRRDFIDANLVIVQRLLEPVERLRATIPETALTSIGRRLTSRYVGELLGFMAQRVLGQYDPVLMLPGAAAAAAVEGVAEEPGSRPPSALYLVEPNIELFQNSQGAPAAPLRRWLILHEVTHAWQFESHPWLGEHIGGLMNDLLGAALADQLAGGPSQRLTPDSLRRLGSTVAGQLRGVGRLQATMSVLEGYGNFVMHRVGRGHIESFDELEAAFHRRKAQTSFLERLVLAVTGVGLKLRQYELGERFAEQVTAAGGYPLLNRLWEGPEMMPSMAELREPDRWIARARQGG